MIRAAVCDSTGGIRMLAVDEFVKGLGRTELGETDVILWFEVEKNGRLFRLCKGWLPESSSHLQNQCLCQGGYRGWNTEECFRVSQEQLAPRQDVPLLLNWLWKGWNFPAGMKESSKEAVYAQIEDNIPDRSSKHYKNLRHMELSVMHWKKSSRRRKEGSAVSELEYVGKRYVREDAYDKARGRTGIHVTEN